MMSIFFVKNRSLPNAVNLQHQIILRHSAILRVVYVCTYMSFGFVLNMGALSYMCIHVYLFIVLGTYTYQS